MAFQRIVVFLICPTFCAVSAAGFFAGELCADEDFFLAADFLAGSRLTVATYSVNKTTRKHFNQHP